MPILNEKQQKHAIEVMKEYQKYESAPPDSSQKTPVENYVTFDAARGNIIEKKLKPLLQSFIEGKVQMLEFKSKIDSINKRNHFWGFRGFKGQMFFNMVVNAAQEVNGINECIKALKSVFSLPASENDASSRLETFERYVNGLGDAWVNAGNTRHKRPKPGSIPFFVSYFWQILDRDVWPVYYTSSVQIMTNLNLWQPSGDNAKDFIDYKKINEELIDLFSRHGGSRYNFYKVEHVFWFKSENQDQAVSEQGKKKDDDKKSKKLVETDLLPQSYIPPIIKIIPQIALHGEGVSKAAKNSGISLEKAFEERVNAAFKIMGFETRLLGQGKGRVPDGTAESVDDRYAIIWDSKIRSSGYSMGTDDRTIREYITTESRDIKKRKKFRNIYYMIISSSFADDFDATIRSIKMDTDVNEVLLLEAEALVAMVDVKLRDPLQITLGSDGIQHLFSNSGVITAQMVKEQLV